MTDAERAQAVVDKWLTIEGIAHITMGWSAKDGIEPIRQQFIEGLTAEFITARVEERAAVLRFLNRLSDSTMSADGEYYSRMVLFRQAVLLMTANRIDNGEHLEGSK